MHTYNGIEIYEWRLLLRFGWAPILFVIAIIVLALFIRSLIPQRDKKQKDRIEKLKERSATDETAKKRLAKIERQIEKKRKLCKKELIFDLLLCAFLTVLSVLTLAFGIIAPVTDYVTKDYIVYTGEITVYQVTGHNSQIQLPDGTRVWGIADFTKKDTYGTVVYTRRSMTVLGGRQ